MKKRILTLVLALVMVCSLLPVTAMAVDDTLTVAGTNVVSGANITYWLCDNGTITSSGASESNYDVKYDPTTIPHTLTLNNANIVSTTGEAIDDSTVVNSLTIKLIGNNTVESTANDAAGIYCQRYLKITAEEDASLSVSGTTHGIQCGSTTEISGKATVTIVGNDCALSSNRCKTDSAFKVYAGLAEGSAASVDSLDDINHDYNYKYVRIEPVTTVAVTGVTVAPATLSLEVGENSTLTAAVAPNEATNKTVSWSSSDEGVATVADGIVTAVAVGSTTITATTEDGGYEATCAVTVTPAVTEYEVYVGGVQVTSANAANVLNDGKVSYAPATNTLTLNGANITGIFDYGTIRADNGLTIVLKGVNTVENTKPDNSRSPSGIYVDGGSLNIESATDASLTVTGTYFGIHSSNAVTITDCTVIAEGNNYIGIDAYSGTTITGSTVTATGKERGIGGGSYVTITESAVTAEGDSYGITAGFSPTITNSTVTAKGEKALNLAPSLGNTNWYQWTITEGGSMTKSTDTAYTYEATHAYLKIEPISAPATVPVTGVTLDKTSLSLAVDSIETLTATVAPDDATNTAVTWSSSAPSVATVADGVVTAVAEGSTIITVTTEDGGYEATCAVTVTSTATDSDIPNPNPNPDDPNPDDPSPDDPSPGPTYPIKKVSSDKGSFSVDSSAAEGETVIITVTPEDGYDVRNLTIIDADGKAIMFKSLGNNRFSFEMPAGKVTVSVTFIESGNNGGTVVKPSFPNGYYPIIPDEEQVETTTSPKTFDSGIALSVGMILLSVTGSAWLGKKKD